MNPLLTIIFVACLATWEIIEIWHHSSLFQYWRARVELVQNNFIRELLMCPFCLSPWVAGLVTLMLYLANKASLDGSDFISLLLAWPVAAMAVARLANLLNDITHDSCRTPRFNLADPADSASGDGDEV